MRDRLNICCILSYKGRSFGLHGSVLNLFNNHEQIFLVRDALFFYGKVMCCYIVIFFCCFCELFILALA